MCIYIFRLCVYFLYCMAFRKYLNFHELISNACVNGMCQLIKPGERGCHRGRTASRCSAWTRVRRSSIWLKEFDKQRGKLLSQPGVQYLTNQILRQIYRELDRFTFFSFLKQFNFWNSCRKTRIWWSCIPRGPGTRRFRTGRACTSRWCRRPRRRSRMRRRWSWIGDHK